MRRLSFILSFGLCASMLYSCSPSRQQIPTIPPGAQTRTYDALPPTIHSDIIPVATFRSVCDRLARSLIAQDFVRRSQRPPVIAIRKLQNKSDVQIDESIFQETIRAKLLEHSQGAILFRDDVSYRDIIEESLRQSDNEVTVTLTDSVVQSKNRDRFDESQSDRGFLSGTGGFDERSNNQEDEKTMELEQSGSVKTKVAHADYFLRGIIYQVKERDARNLDKGMNYFQYQFRLTDARSGIIVWERMLDSKLTGDYQPQKTLQGTQAASPFGGPPPAQPGTQPAPGAPSWVTGGQQPPPTNQGGAGQQAPNNQWPGQQRR